MHLTANIGADKINIKEVGFGNGVIKVEIIDPLSKAPSFELTAAEARFLANALNRYADISEVKWSEYKVEDWQLDAPWINNHNGMTYTLKEKGQDNYHFKNARGDSIYTPKKECAKTWRPT